MFFFTFTQYDNSYLLTGDFSSFTFSSYGFMSPYDFLLSTPPVSPLLHFKFSLSVSFWIYQFFFKSFFSLLVNKIYILFPKFLLVTLKILICIFFKTKNSIFPFPPTIQTVECFNLNQSSSHFKWCYYTKVVFYLDFLIPKLVIILNITLLLFDTVSI